MRSLLYFSVVFFAYVATQPVSAGDQNLFCDNPIAPHTSSSKILKQFKGHAKLDDLQYLDESTEQGISLFPEDPQKRLSVYFFDETLNSAQRIETDESSYWIGPAGLHLGSTLKDVISANGGPFKMLGLGWYHGGLVTDWMGGKLDQMPKGCRFAISFGSDEYAGVPDLALGDNEFIVDEKYFARVKVTIGNMGFWWDTPQ